MSDSITIKAFYESEGVENWRVISDGECAFYATTSLKQSARFVDAISKIDDIEKHPPRVDIRHDGVTVRFLTKSAAGYGLSRDDLDLARQVERVASDQGLSADPTAIQSLLMIPGAPDRAAVMPFWRAVLGYEPRIDSPDEDLVDPHDRDAAFWFEQMDRQIDNYSGPTPVYTVRVHASSRVPYALSYS